MSASNAPVRAGFATRFQPGNRDGIATQFQPGNTAQLPPKPIDPVVIERAASIGCDYAEMGALVGIGERHMRTRVAADPELAEAVERGKAMGRATLRRMQWDGAKAGNPTMLIWLGKQLLGQRDRHELTGEDGGAIVTEVVYRWAEPPLLDAPKDE